MGISSRSACLGGNSCVHCGMDYLCGGFRIEAATEVVAADTYDRYAECADSSVVHAPD